MAIQDGPRTVVRHEARFVGEMSTLPDLVSKTLTLEPAIKRFAKEISQARDIIFLGRGILYPIALEAALKLKEITYIHADGYAAGELKHGPIALIDAALSVVAFAPSGELAGKTYSNLQEVAARGGRVLLVSDDGDDLHKRNNTWKSLALPKTYDLLSAFTYTVFLQLLAYHAAVQIGTDIDQPRNLAKSVTVE